MPGVESVADFFLWLNQEYRFNLTVFYDSYDFWRFADGLAMTVWLSLVCIGSSIAVGLVGAWLAKSPVGLVRRLSNGYILVFRFTPPLVQLYFFYFGVSTLLPTLDDGFGGREPILDGLALAIIALSLYAGSSNVLIFRVGIDSVPPAVVDGAIALGYNRLQIYLYIILPLAFRLSLAPLLNNLVNLVKSTAMAFAVAVPELVYVTNQIAADTGNRVEMMTLLLISYSLLVSVLVWGVGKVEAATRLPGQAA